MMDVMSNIIDKVSDGKIWKALMIAMRLPKLNKFVDLCSETLRLKLLLPADINLLYGLNDNSWQHNLNRVVCTKDLIDEDFDLVPDESLLYHSINKFSIPYWEQRRLPAYTFGNLVNDDYPHFYVMNYMRQNKLGGRTGYVWKNKARKILTKEQYGNLDLPNKIIYVHQISRVYVADFASVEELFQLERVDLFRVIDRSDISVDIIGKLLNMTEAEVMEKRVYENDCCCRERLMEIIADNNVKKQSLCSIISCLLSKTFFEIFEDGY
jgi:hypothetical protein